MERPKTYAERQLERAEAIQRQQQLLTGSGERPCSITSADIPDQIERPKPSRTFVVVGVSIIVLLIAAQGVSLFLDSKKAKQAPKLPPIEELVTE